MHEAEPLRLERSREDGEVSEEGDPLTAMAQVMLTSAVVVLAGCSWETGDPSTAIHPASQTSAPLAVPDGGAGSGSHSGGADHRDAGRNPDPGEFSMLLGVRLREQRVLPRSQGRLLLAHVLERFAVPAGRRWHRALQPARLLSVLSGPARAQIRRSSVQWHGEPGAGYPGLQMADGPCVQQMNPATPPVSPQTWPAAHRITPGPSEASTVPHCDEQ